MFRATALKSMNPPYGHPTPVQRCLQKVICAWKGWLGIPIVRKKGTCHCLNIGWLDLQRVTHRLVILTELECCCNSLRYRQPNGVRPEAQLSDPRWTLEEQHVTVSRHVLLSPEPWNMGNSSPPIP